MYTDQELVQSLRMKDIEAYKFLYKKYSPALFGLLMKELADTKLSEELLHVTFLNIWHNFYQYNSENGRLFTWMYQLVQKELKGIQANKPDTRIEKKNHCGDFLYLYNLKLNF